jgi:hypothetical protein
MLNSLRDAQVGADAHDAHADEDAVGLAGLFLKDGGKVFLDEAGNFILAGVFH